jgi:Phytanoyl-CoA dioxygenase (PhyH)
MSDNVRNLVHDLGWIDPVVPQSMYIFKQPSIGGIVHSHQDSTFLYTTPYPTCLGLWLPFKMAAYGYARAVTIVVLIQQYHHHRHHLI